MNKGRARLLDVGNCDPDHSMIRTMLEAYFDVAIERVMFVREALDRMASNKYDLVLFNRLIFQDGSEGIELLRSVKGHPDISATPVMMISNFPDAQAASVAAGGEPGFGKASVSSAGTRELLSRYLPHKVKHA